MMGDSDSEEEEPPVNMEPTEEEKALALKLMEAKKVEAAKIAAY